MGLFDNIIGTANDGEEATDMDTIVEKIQNGEIDTISDTIDAPADMGSGGGSGGGSSGGDPKDDTSGSTKDPKDDTNPKKNIKTHQTKEVVNIDSIDIGGDMTMLITDDMISGESQDKVTDDVVSKTRITDITAEEVPDTIETEVPVEIVEEATSEAEEISLDIVPTPDNLLDMTDMPADTPLVGGSLLDMTDEPIVSLDTTEAGEHTPIVEDTIAITIDDEAHVSSDAPSSDSLAAAKSGFAEELNSLKQKDEDLIAQNQAEIKKLEDAKIAMQSAERAIDNDIAKLNKVNENLKADEIQIEKTLSSLHINS